jgi:hypothetical protein
VANPDEILASALESSRAVKFGRGVVSKTSYVAASVVVAWIGIALRIGDNIYTNGGLLVAGLVVTAFAIWYIRTSQAFAASNPGQAILDGAEFLEWSRLEAAAKGLPAPVDQPAIEVLPGGQDV